jgi:hypothetical protein
VGKMAADRSSAAGDHPQTTTAAVSVGSILSHTVLKRDEICETKEFR